MELDRTTFDRLTSTLGERFDDVEAALRERVPTELFRPEPIIRTTWPRRMLWTAVGFAAGAAAAYLADHAAGQAKGVAAEAAGTVTPQDVPGDVKTLEAKVKSEVFGHRDDVDKVVLRADGPGVIAVKGTVPTPVAERELLAEIADVEGVTDVHSELTVAGA